MKAILAEDGTGAVLDENDLPLAIIKRWSITFERNEEFDDEEEDISIVGSGRYFRPGLRKADLGSGDDAA